MKNGRALTINGMGSPVGLIGLGTMGGILGRRLLDQDFDVVVYNRTAERTLPLQARGAAVSISPAALAQRCSVIFTVLTGPDALSEVLFGERGVVAGIATGKDGGRESRAQRLLCDLSTQDPAHLQACALRAARYGITLVEAPMAGSVHDATHGTLAFMAGGDPAALQELQPCFSAWGHSTYFGPLGHANTAKLALNLLVGVMAKGLAEALHLLNRNRTSVECFLKVLATSGLSSPLYQRLGDRHLRSDRTVRFSLGNLQKDMALCKAHPSWGEHAPALLSALNDRLQQLPSGCLIEDYSHLLALECDGLARV